MSAEFQNTAAAASAHPEQWELFELLTEGTTELNAHVKAHVATGCPSCGKHLADIRTLSKAREMKEEFDAFFDELPQDDAPADEREEFFLKFKTKNRPADRLGRLAHDGRQFAAEIVKAVSEEKEKGAGLEKAQELLGKIESDPSRGYAYLYACQLAMPKVPSDPAKFVAFAKAVADATRSLPYLKDKGPAQPVCREQVLGEAALLESNALNFLGEPVEARIAAQRARKHFIEAGEDSFALALVDYFEGSAASFACDYSGAWKLLRAAHDEFRIYGQENWQGRAEAAIGALLMNRGSTESALVFFDGALRNLHPERDEVAYASTLINRGYSLVRLSRLDAAKATYAKALSMARRLNMAVSILMIRTGLASIDLASGKLARAMMLFERIGEEARSLGLATDVLCAELRVAECLGRMGRRQDMLDRIERLSGRPDAESLRHDLPLRELFESVENRTVNHEFVAHVARFVEARDRGARASYKPFKLVVNGN
jgi:tetratricopeptide (TPR) repeat protein